MTATIYYIICAILAVGVLLGISFMSKVKTAVMGNALSAISLFAGVIITLLFNGIVSVWSIYLYAIIGVLIGSFLALRVKMIQMPQMVALLNGVGGLASSLVGILTMIGIGMGATNYPIFVLITAVLAILVGMLTLSGSLVAAGKLHAILPQKPVVWKNHPLILNLLLISMLALVVITGFSAEISSLKLTLIIVATVISLLFGYAFAIRVGGADMPITISLLNSLSGVAGAIAGMAISDILLIAVGGIVGASGLFLTQIMCRAMNRSLMEILTGKTSVASKPAVKKTETVAVIKPKEVDKKSPFETLRNAKSVIIVPGYGMALAQAQHLVRQLADNLEANGTEVKYAIHPVAGRMPGHMNVLLAEADVPYEQLYEMDNINPEFATTDAVIIIGANDVLNPAARDAVDTPIYGMPILDVDKASNIFICNFDLNPGYAGVDNPIYSREEGVYLYLGDAKDSLNKILQGMSSANEAAPVQQEANPAAKLKDAKSVIIVPGYGMALAQAQHLVRQLADNLEANGTEVKYAIHPVAGRMPGHMNVLLAEADVPYEQLYEMDNINPEFATTDAVIIIGANDVLNPAARDAVDTPIYGMPILDVDKASNIFICNFDLNPGYAGVDNPIYSREEGVYLYLGDAKDSLNKILQGMSSANEAAPVQQEANPAAKLKDAKSVIIVPGYGMALAQAQHLVRQLADNLEANGTEIKYAIHPVAGRMPGHMNVLLAEADVPYEQLYEMDNINPEFATTDAVIIIGANDVLNPAARDAVDTPIYGMPILDVDKASNIFICNFDLNPGYAGVDNPIYSREEGVYLYLGDAKDSLNKILQGMSSANEAAPVQQEANPAAKLKDAKSVIIVPGYGMALAQAQHLVRQLADNLEANGTEVKYAIHPVAGRMPGHMNVLLAEADVPYEQLYEMDNINPEFATTDAVIIIGANDVLNPAARDAVDTPIYGMPILDVDKASNIFICNYDLNPGYAGVDNPIYSREEGVYLYLGDAKDSLNKILQEMK